MSARIVIDLPPAASEEEELAVLLSASETIALIFRELPEVKVQVQPSLQDPQAG